MGLHGVGLGNVGLGYVIYVSSRSLCMLRTFKSHDTHVCITSGCGEMESPIWPGRASLSAAYPRLALERYRQVAPRERMSLEI